MEQTVNQRVKMIIDKSGLSVNAFASRIGVSQGTLNNMLKRGTEPSVKTICAILDAFPNVTSDWLLHGSSIPSDTQNDPQPSVGIPMLPIDAMAGALSGVGFQIRDYECEHYIVPEFSSADFLITVSGDSMQPTFLSGDILAVKKVPKGGLWFQWGKPYVIATRQGCIVKRIMPSEAEGCVTIVSDNAERYPKFDLSDDEINGIGLVVGLIRSL